VAATGLPAVRARANPAIRRRPDERGPGRLNREGRPDEARTQLRTAHQIFAATGAEAFAERTRRELAATGETVPRRAAEPRGELTAQEGQIARRARDGYSNSEIGAELFLSPRTVEWHLRKVFIKLGISSRRELRPRCPTAPGWPGRPDDGPAPADDGRGREHAARSVRSKDPGQ
jgi:DNA-binding CsgD family transcriptional regulator